MVYRILYYFVNVLLRTYFRKIYITGLENIPKDQALMIVCNHPMGFIEPLIMACTFPIDLNFLVRGDLFEKKALRGLLLSTHQIPIFRFKDGFSSLRNNQNTMNYVVEVMQKKQALVIFAEGSTKMIMHLRPLQKGMARMALQSLEKDPTLDIRVLPVGMTFSRGFSPLSEVYVSVGQTFSINEALNGTDEKEKISSISETAFENIQQQLVHLKEEKDEKSIRNFWDLYNVANSPSFFPRINKNAGPGIYLKKLEEILNDDHKKEQISVQISGLRSELNTKKAAAMVSGIRNPFFFILNILPAAIGMIFFFIPTFAALLFADKKVKQIEFKSSIIAASGGAFTLIWMTTFFIMACFAIGLFKAILFAAILILCGISALYVINHFMRLSRVPKGFKLKFDHLLESL